MRSTLSPPREQHEVNLPAEPLRFRDRQLPAGLMSLGLHLLLAVSLVASLQFSPRGVTVDPDRTTGIVLVDRSQGEQDYLTEEDLQATRQLANRSVGAKSPLPSTEELAVDLQELLPDLENGGSAGESNRAAPRAGDLGGGTASAIDMGGQIRTGVFGVYGEGNRFAYVFDHSGSMGGFGGRPLRAAKSELAKSLLDLERIHQFQIIFYNEKPSVFNPDGGRATLQWGDEATKRLALAFLDGIVAAGGTSHMAALRVALGMKPDVIFFLTDADEPTLSAADLNRIRMMNRGSAIYAVEFGFGPQRSRDNFLVRLAEQNGGQHVYVDISQLPDRR